jgi:hypothetical protein
MLSLLAFDYDENKTNIRSETCCSLERQLFALLLLQENISFDKLFTFTCCAKKVKTNASEALQP